MRKLILPFAVRAGARSAPIKCASMCGNRDEALEDIFVELTGGRT